MENKSKKQIVFGASLAYILIIINAFYGILITPYVLNRLGIEVYGVYKTISSLSSTLMVLDLGIGSTVMRYIAKYKVDKDEKKIANFLTMMFLEAAAIVLIIVLICIVIFNNIPRMYANTFSNDQVILAQTLFAVLVVNMCLHIFENVINGIITGCNDFIFGNGIKLARLLLRIALIFIVLNNYSSAVLLVLIDTIVMVVALLVEWFWVTKKLRIEIRFTHFDKSVFAESFVYTIFVFMTSIINQVNGNLDNVVIGAVLGASAVTIYSMGLLIFNMFENLSTSISGVMLPSITTILNQKDGLIKAQKIVVKVGRIQFALLGAVLVGFVVLGQDFIIIWLGEGYRDVYFITLILMIPAIFELCVNVCLSILRAMNLLKFRTIVLFLTTIMNALITVFGTKQWGYFAACTGTALSWIIGSLICMNIYYARKFKFHIVDMYRRIIGKTWIPLCLAGISVWLIDGTNHSVVMFILRCVLFCLVYFLSMFGIALESEEKKALISLLKKIAR